ncbi:MAG: hypothetical protein ED559_02320 [Phycisphaera sp.]|nr:MAG: hypothetical protein ED559_02320 [Phycisphaera sp.]
MTRTNLAVAFTFPMLLAAGCQTAGTDSGGVNVANTPDETQATAMDTMSQLEGEWQLVGEDGELGPGSTFKVTSAGSIVREIMFEGFGHEMTNVYHMDGDQIVCTHYCAVGNQPRMVAAADGGNSFDFQVDYVSNLLPTHDHYMGGLKLVLVDDNTLEQHWTTFNKEGEVAGEMTFVMKKAN